MNDETDDGGYDAQFRAEDGCDDDVREYYDSLTPEIMGDGWFDQRLSTLHNGINLAAGRSFFANPRARDSMPSSVPARHPLRGLALRLCCEPRALYRSFLRAIGRKSPFVTSIIDGSLCTGTVLRRRAYSSLYKAVLSTNACAAAGIINAKAVLDHHVEVDLIWQA